MFDAGVKVYGVRRSCTTVLQYTLRNSLPNVLMFGTNVPHNKHGRVDAGLDWTRKGQSKFCKTLWEADKVSFVLATKDPYDWYSSYCRSHGLMPSFKYLGNNSTYAWTEPHMVEAAKHYSDSYAHWVSEIDKTPSKWTVVRFEDFILDPTSSLRSISSALGVSPPDVAVVPKKHQHPGGPSIHDFSYSAYKTKCERAWVDKDPEIFESHLDQRVLDALGYSKCVESLA